jgi:hypothetical protein
MNERIKELIEQAVSFRLDPDSNGYEAQVSPEDLELLAKSIVIETIKEVYRQMYWHRMDQLNNPTFHEVIDNTLKHFGVKE